MKTLRISDWIYLYQQFGTKQKYTIFSRLKLCSFASRNTGKAKLLETQYFMYLCRYVANAVLLGGSPAECVTEANINL